MRLSIVTTLYCSSQHVDEFYNRVTKVAKQFCVDDYEIIFVNDGSPDDSLQKVIAICNSDINVRVINLSRNFGHHPAMIAGLQEANGELIFYLDSDLEEKPELLLKFHKIMKDNDLDVVYGVRTDNGKRRISSKLFWSLINTISETDIPFNLANIRLMKSSYVNVLVNMPDKNIFLGGMFHWPGFNQMGVEIERTNRNGPAAYSLMSRIQLALRAIIAFSDGPLWAVLISGLGISLISVMVGLYFVINKLLNPSLVIEGFTSVIISIWFLGGAILAALGIIGVYIAHIYNQTKGRSRYIIKDRHPISGQKK